MASQVEGLYEKLEQSRITGNHVKVIVAAILGDLLEFFDYFLIGFVLAFIVGPWKLNYGQSAVVLLSSGLGAVIGAVFWGHLADRIGRRPIFISTVLCFSISTGMLYFTPEGAWGFLAGFRFLTGFGVGGLYAIDLPLVQEFVPSRYRGAVSGIVTSFIPLGIMLGSILAAYMTPFVGWRGLFLIGLIPAVLTLLIRVWVPESPRWLISRGRYREAEKAISWVLGSEQTFAVADATDDNNAPAERDKPAAERAEDHIHLMELFKYPRSLIVSWGTNFGMQTGVYGLTLWGPTLLAMILGVKPTEAAKLYIAVTIAGFLGRWFWSFSSDWFGRRRSGFVLGVLGGILLFIAAINHDLILGTVSAFWIFIICANFFMDGGFAIVGPYASEVWPKHLRASGMGSAYGFGGIGKILGPIVLAFFAGSGNMVTPKATTDAIIPAFTFLALLAIGAGVLYLFGIETRGKSIEQIDTMLTGEEAKKVGWSHGV
jgi:putative MFS transporter